MTYDRIVQLLLGAGVAWAEADQVARELGK